MENRNIHNNPRINARTCLALCKGTDEELLTEMTIEMIVDKVFKEINSKLEYLVEEYEDDIKDDDMSVNIKYANKLEDEVVSECNNRLRDLGFLVQYVVETDEEIKLLQELSEEAEDDDLIAGMLEEMMSSGREFKVSWHTIDE